MTQPSNPDALLEVVVLHPRDAAAATLGGADRLLLAAGPDGAPPDAASVSAVVRETDLPVRVHLVGARPDVLIDPALRFAELGATGFCFGFLDRDLEVDVAACVRLAEALGLPWTFDRRAFDAALEIGRAWRAVAGLPGLDAVATAGSTRGMAIGGEELTARAAASSAVAELTLACGGLVPDQVPWLARVGIRQFGVGSGVRPGNSWTKAYVDAAHVRTWRMLVDDAVSRALGVPVD